jgi:Zn-dependent protease
VGAVAASSLPEFLRNLVLYLVPMILSVTVHEYAHAIVATRLGDDTPAREERLTLSPAAHVDLFGTIFVPTMSILLAGQAFIGWAKPVNINPSRFRRDVNMRTGLAISSAAGPLSNLLLATLSIALLTGLTGWGVLDGANPMHKAMMALMSNMFLVNVGLCVFNLLPIPPLDGSRLLPRSLDGLVERVTPYSMLLLMAVLMVPALNELLIGWPIRALGTALLTVFGGGGRLSS